MRIFFEGGLFIQIAPIKFIAFVAKFLAYQMSLLGKSGINDWKHGHVYLQSHENSVYHLECLNMWFETSF